MNIERFDEFISQYPIYEYRILDTKDIFARERVRIICQTECQRYGSTWACPPAVGTLEECEAKIKSYSNAVFFSSVAEVSDVLNMEEMLATRQVHEELTTEVGDFLKSEGHEIYILSTESCDICEVCTYPNAPCRFPEKMHPCVESHGIIVCELAEKYNMEFTLSANQILWFGILFLK